MKRKLLREGKTFLIVSISVLSVSLFAKFLDDVFDSELLDYAIGISGFYSKRLTKHLSFKAKKIKYIHRIIENKTVKTLLK